MLDILDIHTHHSPPQPHGVIAVKAGELNPMDNQLYSIGIHPWDSGTMLDDGIWETLLAEASRPEVVAIGECGIDMLKGAPLFRQMQIFKRHIDLSEKLKKPLVIHDVKAHDVIIGIKKDLNPQQPWVIHGFRGKPTVATMLSQAGIYLSIGEKFNPESIPFIPENMILAETDESSSDIFEIIKAISDAAVKDLMTLISANTSKFLGLTE